MFKIIDEYINILVELLFPRDLTCVLCGRELFDVNKGNLCNVCMASLQFIVGDTCSVCGRMLHKSDKYRICSNCKSLERYFDIGVSVIKYDDYSKKIFFDFKYFDKRYYGHTMAVYLKEKLVELDLEYDIDYFVPVPLHENKMKKRTFNQAEVICEYLTDITGIKTYDCLIRQKETMPLNNLHRDERKEILKGAFKIKENINLNDKVIVIVDDIFTTGTTMNECSKILKDEGVKYIISACFGVGD